MKRFAFAAALAVFAVSLSFGDDAEVLPNGVARLRLIPSFSSIPQSYDKDGKANDASDKIGLNGINGAFEFGLTDAVTLGLKWAPGFTYSTSHSDEANKHALLTGPADLELGGKLQILGPKGFVPNDQLRLALTPGLSIPLDNWDPIAEGMKAAKTEDFRYQSASAHQSLGFGAKADLDYVISEMFFINVHGQALSFLPHEAVTITSASQNAGAFLQTGSQATADAVKPLIKVKTTYGLEYTAEFEPHAKFALGGDSSLNFGIPVIYEASLADKTETGGTSTDQEDVPAVTSIGPWASFFTLIGPLPIEIQVQYSLPVMGKSSPALSTLSAQIKLFYKFY